jgi:hypothetical protein
MEASGAWRAVSCTDRAMEDHEEANCVAADVNAAGCCNQQRKCVTGRLIDKLVKLVRQHTEH